MSVPQKEPRKEKVSITEAVNTVLVVIEGGEDTTRRPRPPYIPYTPPPSPAEEPPQDNGQP